MTGKQQSRCMRCEAPIVFTPGAGSRLCPFCEAINLVREQSIAAPPAELKIDQVFRSYQSRRLSEALQAADRLTDTLPDNYRLALYRSCILLDSKRVEDAIYALIDLTGMEAPNHLRADTQAILAKALLAAGRTEESEQAARKSLELLDGNPSGSLILAECLRSKGDNETALRITEETLGRLNRSFKVTLPPSRSRLQLLQAELLISLERKEEAADALEDLLLNNISAPLEMIRSASLLLGQYYVEYGVDQAATVDLLRQAAILDPENRSGLLDTLRIAAEKSGTEFSEEIQSYKTVREEYLAEIRSVLAHGNESSSLRPDLITPNLDLTLLDPDPDTRTDLLEQAVGRMQLTRFDRGTLYPLKTVEDFRRWTAVCRLRDQVRRIRRSQNDRQRREELQAARASSPEKRSSKDKTYRPNRPRPWFLIAFLMVLVVLGLLVTFTVMAGDRFLDSFQGQLSKVECQDKKGSPPCSLYVASGEEGRKRYRARQLKRTWLAKLLGRWLDGRVQSNGTIVYPLHFPWADIPAEKYERCLGRPIEKMRFTLEPICNPDQP